jgi:putative intracellular protease/amidase
MSRQSLALVLTGAVLLASPAVAERNVAILVFDGVQTIDFAGPYEIFDTLPEYRVFTVAESLDPVTAEGGLRVVPNYAFGGHPPADVLVVPGGNYYRQLPRDAVMRWIRETAADADVVLSVCSGAFLLARAGLLDGLEATTTAFLVPQLAAAAPRTRVVANRRFVDNGRVVTAAGLSAGLDAALHVLEKLHGRGIAQRVALSQEYRWDPAGAWTRGALAERLLPSWLDDLGGAAELARTEGDERRWVTAWSVTVSQPAAEVLSKVERALARALGGQPIEWRRRDGSGGAAEASSRWLVVDEQGIGWDGALSVRAADGGVARYLVTAEVESTGEPAPRRAGEDRRQQLDPRLDVGQQRVGLDIPADLDVSSVRNSEAGRFRVTAKPRPASPGQEPRGWSIEIRDRSGDPVERARVTVGGGMPQHGHGLPMGTRDARELGAGLYLVEGLQLGAMSREAAWWELRLLVAAGGAEDLVVFNVVVEPSGPPAPQRPAASP